MSEHRADPPELVFRLTGAVSGHPVDLVIAKGESVLGSSRECNLVLRLPTISRRHAILVCHPDHLALRDLDSTNGTWVNGVRTHAAQVGPGDMIAFGSVQLTVVRVEGGDRVLAIESPMSARSDLPGLARGDDPTSTAPSQVVPERWLEGLARIAVLSRNLAATDASEVLEVLRSTLSAPAMVLARVDNDRPACLLATVGALPSAPLGIETVSFAGSTPDRVRSFLNSRDPLLALAYSPAAQRSRVILAAVGDYPQRSTSGRLIEAALNLWLPLVTQDAPPAPRTRRLVEDICLPPGMVAGDSPAIVSLYRELRVLARGDIPVLITGETGVGKEVVARILHLTSRRRLGPFAAVNCAAIPTELLEAELFGIERGVATGVEPRAGKILLATKGVLFLDEIADLSPAAQAKLLRVLQEREVHPLGAPRPTPVDIRVLAATNAYLPDRVTEGRFRPDLFHRIAGATVRVPPLRERREDIPLLVQHLLRRHLASAGLVPSGVTEGALRLLTRADWPGNIRELDHEVQRLVLACPPGQPITARLVSPGVAASAASQPIDPTSELDLRHHVRRTEMAVIGEALRRAGGSSARAARLLGLTRQGLSQAMKRLGIDPTFIRP